MAYAFMTYSGSLYKVENGRLSRIADADVRGCPNTARIDEIPVRVLVAPKVGACAVFRTHDSIFGGRLCTSRVTHVIPIVEVQRVSDFDPARVATSLR